MLSAHSDGMRVANDVAFDGISVLGIGSLWAAIGIAGSRRREANRCHSGPLVRVETQSQPERDGGSEAHG